MIAGATPTSIPVFVPTTSMSTVNLNETVDRLRRCRRASNVYAVHNGAPTTVDAETLRVSTPLVGPTCARAIAGRKWATTCWRGGLGGATIFDEVIEPAAIAEALHIAGVDSGLVVGENWLRVDPAMCDELIERHLGDPASRKLVFTQAPPGLCGIVVSRSLMNDLAQHGMMLGTLLSYQPRNPQGDPIARDVCVQVPAELRAARVRAIADHERWRHALRATDSHADAMAVAMQMQSDRATPQQVTIELTPDRQAAGPITPQRHAIFDRQPMSLEVFNSIMDQLRGIDDLSITLGGIGDALCHDDWRACIDIARDAGVWGLCVQTDLLCDQKTLAALVAAPVDAIVVRLNADDAERYAALMGVDGFAQVMSNMQWLLKHRENRLPWLVPAMVKTTDNVDQIETFVDRWTIAAGHALVLGPSTGRGAMPDQSVLPMPVPASYRAAMRASAMHVLSNGKTVDEDDWQAGDPFGDLSQQPLADVWAQQIDAPAGSAA